MDDYFTSNQTQLVSEFVLEHTSGFEFRAPPELRGLREMAELTCAVLKVILTADDSQHLEMLGSNHV